MEHYTARPWDKSTSKFKKYNVTTAYQEVSIITSLDSVTMQVLS